MEDIRSVSRNVTIRFDLVSMRNNLWQSGCHCLVLHASAQCSILTFKKHEIQEAVPGDVLCMTMSPDLVVMTDTQSVYQLVGGGNH
jgi:hypothetical protein